MNMDELESIVARVWKQNSGNDEVPRVRPLRVSIRFRLVSPIPWNGIHPRAPGLHLDSISIGIWLAGGLAGWQGTTEERDGRQLLEYWPRLHAPSVWVWMDMTLQMTCRSLMGRPPNT